MKWLDKLPWTARELPSFLFLVVIFGFMETARAGFLYVYLTNYDLGLDKASVGLAATILLTTESLSRGIGGWLVQRLGLGAVAQLAALTGLFTVFAVTNYPNHWTLWVLSFFWGLAISPLLPGLFTHSSRIASPGREGRALAFTNFLPIPFIGLGWVATTFFVKNIPHLAPYFLYASLIVPALLAFAIYRIREPLQIERNDLRRLLPVLAIVPVAFGQTFAPGLLSLILVRFYSQSLGLTEWQFYLAMGSAAVVAFVATGWLGRFADRNSPRVPLIIGLLVMSLVFFGVGMTPSYEVFFALVMLGALGFATVLPSWNALLVKVLPEQSRATIWGSLMVVEGLGSSLSPAVGGFLWDAFGHSAPFFAGAGIFLTLALFYMLLFSRVQLHQLRS